MSKKYLKNENGTVRAMTTDNLQLEKPLLNENYDIDVHNRNMDKIDNAIQEVKGEIDSLELVASNVKMADGSTAEEAINLNKNKISNLQDEVLVNKSNILTSTELASQALNKANEAFQRGDNVKKQLVDKLISEGLNVSTNNTFEKLIENISLGKKWASGECNINHNNSNILIAGLEFTPTTIIISRVFNNPTSTSSVHLCLYCPLVIGDPYRYVIANTTSSQLSFSSVSLDDDSADSYILNNSFSINTKNSTKSYVYKWLAIE